MDPRKQKTQTSIINAFIQLRARKPLEKITVRELAQLADINKATFYLHYQDVYQLSHTLEAQTIQSILADIRHPEYFFQQPAVFIQELNCAILGQGALLHILFPGNYSQILADRLLEGLQNYLAQIYPGRKPTLKEDVTLAYMVYGSYFAYTLHQDHPEETLKVTAEISELIQSHYQKPPENTDFCNPTPPAQGTEEH